MADMVDKLRNIALVAHGGAGKTSLAEVMLFNTGVTNRLGKVEEGNTQMDFEPEELKRNSSISTGFHQLCGFLNCFETVANNQNFAII